MEPERWTSQNEEEEEAAARDRALHLTYIKPVLVPFDHHPQPAAGDHQVRRAVSMGMVPSLNLGVITDEQEVGLSKQLANDSCHVIHRVVYVRTSFLELNGIL